MLRSYLSIDYGVIPEDQLKMAFDMATLDIKANRYLFNKRTSLKEAIKITGMCLHVLQTRISYTKN